MMITSLVLHSCSSDDDGPKNLTSYEKQIVDSIYARDISKVRKVADSLCAANKDKYFEYFADSIRQVYLDGIEDMEDYLNKASDE